MTNALSDSATLKHPVERCMTQPQSLLSLSCCDFPLSVETNDIIPVRRLADWLAAFVLSFSFSDGDTLSLTLKSTFPLELGKPRKDREHQLALGRSRIDVLFQGDEGHFLLLKFIDDEEKILRRPGEAGIGLDNHCVSFPHEIQ